MKNKNKIIVLLILMSILFAIPLLKRQNFLPFLLPLVFAHCDTMDGPVIQAAKKALETGNIDLVLIWVKERDEAQIKKVFAETLAARKLNQESADMHFFETLVRIHRAGEGAPYEGIKPAGSEVEPGIKAADEAVETGSVDNLVNEVSGAIVSGIRQRFGRLIEKKAHMSESVSAGREYVEAYVEFIHYVEKLHQDISNAAGHHHAEE